VQPTPKHFWLLDRSSLACQDEEHRLKGILGILSMAGHPPANSQDKRTMSDDEFPESHLIPFAQKSLEEVTIGRCWFLELSQDVRWTGPSHLSALFPLLTPPMPPRVARIGDIVSWYALEMC
jgi:hypothetical protein